MLARSVGTRRNRRVLIVISLANSTTNYDRLKSRRFLISLLLRNGSVCDMQQESKEKIDLIKVLTSLSGIFRHSTKH